MSSIGSLNSNILQNTVNASQQEIDNLLKQLSTGLKINSAADDPANVYVSNTLNLKALESSSTATNAQNGLTYLQIAQKAYSDIVTELSKIKDLANKALTGTYDSVQIADFQKQITDSINAIKLIETGTTFNGIQVFNNSNSAALVNEHMFAITSKTDVTVTTTTIVDNRGLDYSDYLANDIDRYDKKDIGGNIALVNDAGQIISFDPIHVTTSNFKAIVSGMTLGIGLDKNYILDQDIDVAALGINTNGKALFQGEFIGTFDGNGHTISNVTITNTDTSYDPTSVFFGFEDTITDASGLGVFDRISGSVSNLKLSNISVSVAGNQYRAGTLAGVVHNGAAVSNVNVLSGTVSGLADSRGLGGLVGLLDDAKVSSSSSAANVTGAWYLGGLVGIEKDSTIEGSLATGTVNVNQATARTDGNNRDRIAGALVGLMADSVVEGSRSTGNVSNSHYYSGGIAGSNYGASSISNSYATGNISSSWAVGGIIANGGYGLNISNCYASTTLSANGAGGVYGVDTDSAHSVTVSNSFYDSTKYTGGNLGLAADNTKWINSGGLATGDITSHTGNFSTYTNSWDPNVWNLAAGAPTLKQSGFQPGVTSLSGSSVTTIENAQQLISALSGTTAGKTFILLDNIDLSSLGTQSQALIQPTFQGTLMGNGYVISGLSINSTSSNTGLFAQLGASAKVQDLVLKDFTIKGANNVGTLAGSSTGATVTNVVALNVNNSGNSAVGGLLGTSSGTVSYSYTTGKVKGDAVSVNMGGLIGEMNSSTALVTNSFSNVDVIGGTNVGGLVGGIDSSGNAGTVTQSYARGSVTGQTRVGGLVGYSSGTVSNSYALGDVTGNNKVAGLVGENYGATAVITNSYSLSRVKDSTTVYDSALFTVKNTTEVVNGLPERPTDAFAITFDYLGKTYAFDTAENFNKFKAFTLGSPNGTIGLFYEKDAVNNTWYGRKLESTSMYSYTSGALPDAPVNGVPEDDNGVNYTVLTTIAAGGYAAAGTYAFKNEADKTSFLTFNSTNTTTTAIDKFYKLDAANNKWNSQALTLGAATYHSYTVSTATSANAPASSYGLFNDFWTDTTGMRGTAGSVYAFENEDDKNAFINSNDTIGLYYRSNGDNTWSAYKQIVSTSGNFNYSVSSVTGATAVDDPQDDLAHYVYRWTDAGGNTYAFASQDEMNNYNNGTPLGPISKFYVRASGADDVWTAQKVSSSSYAVNDLTGNVASAPMDADGVIYNYIKPIGGVNYAFANKTDFDNYANGSPVGIIGTFYKQVSDNTVINAWEKYTVTKVAGTTNYVATTTTAPLANSAPVDPDGVDYNIEKYISSGPAAGYYRFATQQDADNFNDGVTLLNTVSKFYKYVSGDSWNPLTIKVDVNPTVTPVYMGTTGTVPVDAEGLMYSYQKTVIDPNDGKSYTYAFASVTDMNNFVDENHFRALIGRYYKDLHDGSANPWKGCATSFYSNAVITPTGSSVINKPVSTDGINYNIFSSDAFGNTYAFASQVDKDNWNNGNYQDSINRFYVHANVDPNAQWTGYSVTQHPAYVTYSYSMGGMKDAGGNPIHIDAMPHDSDGVIYAVQKTITIGANSLYYRFSSQADADNFNDGMNFLGTVSKFYRYTDSTTDTWEAMSLNSFNQSVTLLGSVQSTPLDADGVAYTYTKSAIDPINGLARTYAFSSVTDMNNFVTEETFLAPIGRFYKDTQDGSIDPWKGMGAKVAIYAKETSVVAPGINSQPIDSLFSYLWKSGTTTYAVVKYDDYWNELLNPNADRGVTYLTREDGSTDWKIWNTTMAVTDTVVATDSTSEYNPYVNIGGDSYYFSTTKDKDNFISYYLSGASSLTQATSFKYMKYSMLEGYTTHQFTAAFTQRNDLNATMGSKPNDTEYTVNINYGAGADVGTNGELGFGNYYFSSEADWTMFSKINDYFSNGRPASIRPAEDAVLTYYKQDGETWKKFTLTYDADPITVTTLPGWNRNKPDDPTYSVGYENAYNYVDTTLACGAGLYFFQTDSDRTAFTKYVNGSKEALDINFYYMAVPADPGTVGSYLQNPSNFRQWNKFHLAFGTEGSITMVGHGTYVASQPINSAYSYYSTQANAWFANQAEADIFWQWQNGGAQTGLNGTGKTFNDIYWYQHVGYDTDAPRDWYAYKLWSVNHQATYTTNTVETVWSRPNDNSYAISGVDPNNASNILYFNSTADMTTYINYLTNKKNGIDPTETFDINFYEYNSTNDNWELKNAREGVQNDIYNWIYCRPNDISYSITNGANGYYYIDNGKANGSGLYYFQSEADRASFENYLAGGTGSFDISYMYFQSEGSIWRDAGGRNDDPAAPSNDRTWTKYHLEKRNPLVQDEARDSANNELGTVLSKPKSPVYGVQSTYGGGNYWFSTEGEKNIFERYMAGSLTGSGLSFSDIYYYERTGNAPTANWRQKKLVSNVIADKYNQSAAGALGYANSRPNDNNYITNTLLQASGSTAGVKYDGTLFFASADDLALYNSVRNGTQTGAINDIFYYKFDSAAKRWDRKSLSNTYEVTPYGGGPHSGSPSVLGYEKVWHDTPHNKVYAFNNDMDMSNFQAYINGTLTGSVDFLFYEKITPGVDSWQQKRIKASLVDTTYTTQARAADNTKGRPVKDGYDLLSSDGMYAFLSTSDLEKYNSGIGVIDRFYHYNAGKWDSMKRTQDPGAYTQGATGTSVDGMPDEDDFGTIYKSGGIFYAFKDVTDRNNFINDLTQSTAGVNKFAAIDRYFQYDAATNKWQARKMSETVTQDYGIIPSNPTDTKVGLAEKPYMAGYAYLATISSGANIGTYAFDSIDDRTSFLNFDSGVGTVKPILNYYKLDTVNKLPDPISGKLIDSWDGQKLEYDNNVGYLVGKNSSGTISNSFFGSGANSANYIGDDGVRILGNTQIASDVNPISTNWSSAIWDWTSTDKPILRSTKKEGTEEISEANLKELENETKYVFHIHDDYDTTNIWLDTALTSGSFTQLAPASAPVGKDAAGRPLVASMVLSGITNMYLSDFTVSNNANINQRFTEGKDFVVYTNDNGATWRMDVLSADMYGKTLKIDYAGAATTAIDQAISGFNIYLGDNKSLNVRDMSLDLAGRLNFNVTREEGARGALSALEDTLTYMNLKQLQLTGQIQAATAALDNKVVKTTTMTTAVKNIVSIDEAKAKAELAKRQLLQSKTDTILQKFYDLQTASMQSLLSASFSNNSSAYGAIYSGLNGVNSLYNKNIVNYNYRSLYDLLDMSET